MPIIYAGNKIYIETIKDLLNIAKEEITKGKLEHDKERRSIYFRQAGEKCYNAIMQLAYVLKKNEFYSHEELDRFYSTTRRINKSTAYALMNTGNLLHINFYHGNLSEDKVERSVDGVNDLINNILRDLTKGKI